MRRRRERCRREHRQRADRWNVPRNHRAGGEEGRDAWSQSLIQNYRDRFHALALRRAKSWIDAMNNHAVAEAVVCSKSLARRPLRPSYAKVRLATQRLGKTSKPLAWSDRLMISTVHFPILRNAWRSLSPA